MVFSGSDLRVEPWQTGPTLTAGPTLGMTEALPSGRWGLVVEDEYSAADDAAHTMRRLGGEAVRPPPDQHGPLRVGR